MAVELDDIVGARKLLSPVADGSGVRCVLFDFDGPICQLFPDDSSRPLADEVRKVMADFGVVDVLIGEERTGKDPHLLLRAARRVRGAARGDLVRALEKCVTSGELKAVRRPAPLTPKADVLIRQLAGQGLLLAVVTNNSRIAADSYLRIRGLRRYFKVIHGRTTDLDLMKPHPDTLFRALGDLGVPPTNAVMIGDTPTDVEAARSAGVRFIGYGRNELKRTRLRNADADIVLGEYAPLLDQAGERSAGGPGDRLVDETACR
ncbi:HAD family hydrolase [Streptomyces sp. HD]|uniref:HAD family hydrolase n=1 Tax=Streptomyces sp. HD TaxID=3020892 RepID=UPI00232B0378|nr:HAD family hydrolase [Streptomyces sp. HD]MDC0770235.1 HAD family hydrolase [Streptomyces sp. HD]